MRTVLKISAMLVLCAFCVGARAQKTTGMPGLTPEQDALFAAAQKDFFANNYKEALTKFQTLHAQVPDNAIFAKFGAEAAVNTGDYTAATALLTPVLAATPEDPQALGIQAHLFGQQHNIVARDAALAHLQKLHDDGTLKLQSVIVEKDPLPNGGEVTIIDFLEPFSRFHIALMARFYDASGKQTSRIALESDDIDQISFAKDHPKEAAAGIRIYSMDSYSERPAANGTITQTHGTMCPVKGCFMTGRPTYEFFREHVLKDTNDKPPIQSSVPLPPKS
jgi:hypothetical protein